MGPERHRDGAWIGPQQPALLRVMPHADRAIEQLMEPYPRFGVAAIPRAGRDVIDAALELDGIVMIDHAAIAEAQDTVQIEPGGERTIRRAGVVGGDGKGGIVAIEIGGQERRGDRVGHGQASQAQLRDEAILQGTPKAFNAALGLGRASGDGADAQLDQGPAELRRLLSPRQLFLGSPARMGITHEDAMPIVIEGVGDAVGGEHLAQQEEVAMSILLSAKDRGHHAAGGVVDRRQKGGAWPIGPEPGVRAAIDLQEHAFLGVPIAATTMAGSAPRMWCRDTTGSKDAADTGAAEKDLMVAREELGDVGVIAIGVVLSHERAHTIAELLRQRPGFGTLAIAVDHGGTAVPQVGGFEAPDLPFGHAQQEGGFDGRTAPGNQAVEDGQALLLTGCEGDGSIGSHAPEIGARPPCGPAGLAL